MYWSAVCTAHQIKARQTLAAAVEVEKRIELAVGALRGRRSFAPVAGGVAGRT